MAVLKCSDKRHGLRNPSIPGNEDLVGLWVTVLGQHRGPPRKGDHYYELCDACNRRNVEDDVPELLPGDPPWQPEIDALDVRVTALGG